MAYNNPIFRFSDDHPVLAWFIVPVLMHLAGSGVYYVTRTLKTGSPLQGGINAGEEAEENPLSALGSAGTSIRKQGGSDLDLVFRATSNPRPTGPGTGLWDTVMPSPTQQPVRYDEGYHSNAWIDDPTVGPHAPRPVNAHGIVWNEDISVFNGLNGMKKIRR